MKESFYVYETQAKPSEYARECTECDKGMDEGYLFELSGETYCSKECSEKAFLPEDLIDHINVGNLFWTEWHDEVEGTG